MTARKSGLGRGLAALIPDAPESRERIPQTDVAISHIVPNPLQPRTAIDPEQLEELANSIREHGVIQPLLVSELESSGDEPLYQLIAGERRLRAARAAGLERVPVTIRQTTPRELLELAIIENVQRADLNPLEEGMAYQRLIEEFGLTQQEAANRVGRSRTAVANILRLLELPEQLRASLANGEISAGHARALLGIPDDAGRRAGGKRIVSEGLNVRQTEQMVRNWGGASKGAARKPPAIDRGTELVTESITQALQRELGTKATLKRKPNGQGTLTIHFYSDEELDGVLERILGPDAL